MSALLIAMTIFGCDDSMNHCNYLDMVKTRFETVEACDSQLEATLAGFQQSDYPTVVAVCREPGELVNAALGRNPGEPAAPVEVLMPQVDPALAPKLDQPGMLKRLKDRSLAALMGVVPSRRQMGAALAMPAHVVTGGYSWVIRRVNL